MLGQKSWHPPTAFRDVSFVVPPDLTPVSQVSGLLQRLTVAEMSIAEEQSKREILMRYFQGGWTIGTFN